MKIKTQAMSVNIVLVQIRARAFFHKDLRMMTYPGIRPDTTPAWISNHICSVKCGMKLLIQSETSTVQTLKFGNGYTITPHTL